MAAYNKPQALLTRIAQYCEEIERMTDRFGNSFQAYQTDSAYRYACGMCIFQIGELASRLPEKFRDAHNGIPWKSVRGMRNIFALEYGNINDKETWAVIEERLPELKSFCIETLSKMATNGDSA
jgi:uncharacterized protein with HEPN domain